MTMDLQQQVRQEQARLEQVVADALTIARQLGADSAEISISKQTGLSVNTRGGEVESIEFIPKVADASNDAILDCAKCARLN